MKILITGVSGFIGGKIAYALSKKENTIWGQGNNFSPLNFNTPNLQLIKGGILSPRIKEEIKTTDVIIHCAGKIELSYGRNREVEKINIEETTALFKLAIESGVKQIIYFSSIHAYKTNVAQISENSALEDSPEIPYNYSKSMAQQNLIKLCNGNNTSYTILNPTGVIGNGDYRMTSANKMFKLLGSNKLPVVPAYGYNFVDVDDVTEITIKAINNPIAQNQTFILGNKYFEVFPLLKSYGKKYNTPKPLLKLPISVLNLFAPLISVIEKVFKTDTGLNKYTLDTLKEGPIPIDNQKVKKAFGFEFTPMENTLEKIHLFLKDL